MNTKYMFLAIALSCFALATARPEPGVRKPKGTCPAKDGATPVYLADDTDCSIFYECDDGVANPKQCLPGLCFDTTLNVCAFPPKIEIAPRSAVGTCPPRDTNETIYLPDSESCAKYYVCSNGKPIEKECPPEMSWNVEKHICDWAIDVQCNENATIPLTAVGTCPPRDTNVTIYLPDSDNCTIYYICSNGHAIQSVCPPDMSWNNDKHICDWDLDANCEHFLASKHSKHIEPLTADGKCPVRDGNVTVFLPDTDNCTIYYICSNGRPFPATCTPGMVWSTRLNICDWDADENCVPDSDQEFKKSARKPSRPVGECPSTATQFPVFLADAEDCQIYWECSNGVPIPNTCAPGLVWDTTLNTCVLLIDGDCSSSEGKRRIQPRSAVGECPEKDGSMPVYLPDSDSCQVYYECDDGVAIKNVCPDDLEFNPIKDVCDNPLDSGCTAGGSSVAPSSGVPTSSPAPPASSTVSK